MSIEVRVIDPVLFGDVNNDGRITAADSVHLRQWESGWWMIAPDLFSLRGPGADVNNDGVINAADLLLLNRFLADWWMDFCLDTFEPIVIDEFAPPVPGTLPLLSAADWEQPWAGIMIEPQVGFSGGGISSWSTIPDNTPPVTMAWQANVISDGRQLEVIASVTGNPGTAAISSILSMDNTLLTTHSVNGRTVGSGGAPIFSPLADFQMIAPSNMIWAELWEQYDLPLSFFAASSSNSNATGELWRVVLDVEANAEGFGWLDLHGTFPGFENFVPAIALEFENGRVSIFRNEDAGDADGDGEVTPLDLVTLRMFIAGHPVGIDFTNADVNGDGHVDELDVYMLRHYLAGHNVTLG